MWQNYFKIAWRNLLAEQRYFLLNTIGLSVGIACGLLIFLFLRHHLSTDRHHAKFDRIFRIDTDLHLADGSIEYNAEAPLPMTQVLRQEYPQVEQAAFLIINRELTVTVKRPHPDGQGQSAPIRFLEHKGTGLTEPAWFDILSYTWLQGNPLTALHDPNRVVLTQSWAKRYFGDSNPIGQQITLNNRVVATVTGLLADPPATTDTDLGLFISLATLKNLNPAYDAGDWGYLDSMNRLYVTLKNSQSARSLDQALPALAKKHYGADAHIYQFHAQPLRELHFDVERGGSTIRSSLLWSLAVVGLLLIAAACINFVNLTTAQALRRSKEVGIRKTLGSSRRQLAGQFLLETTLLVFVATGLALGWVILLLPLFNKWVQLPLLLRLDGATLLFISLLFVSIILLAGGYPAVILSGFSPGVALRGSATGSSGRGFTVRRVLVVMQFAVCQALILGALVVANQIHYIQKADLGFRSDNVVVVTLPPKQAATREAFKQTLAQYTDIRAVSFSQRPPASDQASGGSFKFDGRPDWVSFPVLDRLADADYVKTYGLKLIAGRNIMASDTIREYLINETLLHQLGFRNPQQVLGRKLQYYLSAAPLPIVGVVSDFHMQSLRQAIAPCFIASYAEAYVRAGIQISGQNPAQTLQRIQQIWQQLYPNEVFEYQFLNKHIARFYETEQLVSRLITAFTGIAILICGLGLYGLVAYVVVQRTKEIGVRKVLGASVGSIVTLLSKDLLKLVLLAIVLASPLAWYVMNKWLADFAYRMVITGWVVTLAGVLAVGIALLTVSFQTIRAARMNPVKTLRRE